MSGVYLSLPYFFKTLARLAAQQAGILIFPSPGYRATDECHDTGF